MGNAESESQSSAEYQKQNYRIDNQNRQMLYQQKKIIEEQNRILTNQQQQINYLMYSQPHTQQHHPPLREKPKQYHQPPHPPHLSHPPSVSHLQPRHPSKQQYHYPPKQNQLVTVQQDYSGDITYNDYQRKIQTEEELYTQMEREEQVRRKRFEDEMRQRRDKLKNEYGQMKDKINIAYQILQIDETYTPTSLKKAYLKMAMKHHPDKGGDAITFQNISKAFALLNEHYNKNHENEQKINRTYDQYVNEHSSITTEFQNNGKANKSTLYSNSRFNVDMFNKMYQENRLNDPTDYGYGEWLNSSSSAPDIKQKKQQSPELFSDQFNLNMFNKLFEQEINSSTSNKDKIVVFEEPSTITLRGENVGYSALGVTKIDDFTGATKSGLKFTDIKKAYTHTTLNPGEVAYKTHSSIQQYEKEREAALQRGLDDNERRYYEQKKYEDERNERERMQNVQEYDIRARQHYERVNNLISYPSNSR